MRPSAGGGGALVPSFCFCFCGWWRRGKMREALPYPKRRRRLPIVLSPEEVERLIAGAKNLYHRTLLLTLYGAGLRRSELCRLNDPPQRQYVDEQRATIRSRCRTLVIARPRASLADLRRGESHFARCHSGSRHTYRQL